MSEQSHYEQLGVTEDASFEEIQEARDRLKDQCPGDQKRLESIEAAYDAILMDRLRLRQEGKIKVPERIRFPERLAEVPSSFTPVPVSTGPVWLQQLVDTPSRADILWPVGIYTVLMGVSVYPAANPSILQLTLALGVSACLYFLNRKEHKFGRSVLLTITALVTGLILGGILGPLGAATGLATEKFITVVTFIILWLVSSFLK